MSPAQRLRGRATAPTARAEWDEPSCTAHGSWQPCVVQFSLVVPRATGRTPGALWGRGTRCHGADCELLSRRRTVRYTNVDVNPRGTAEERARSEALNPHGKIPVLQVCLLAHARACGKIHAESLQHTAPSAVHSRVIQRGPWDVLYLESDSARNLAAR